MPGKATGAGACATIDRDIESPLFAAAWDSAERIEGVAALIGKRRPVWPE